MSKIELPKLTNAQIEEIQSLYAGGETLNAIQAKTGVRYSAVYFYAVNKGVPAPAEDGYTYHRPYQQPVNCWCGQRQHAKGLCGRHYKQQARAAQLMAVR